MEREQVAAAAAAEETMALYDACWFQRCVLVPSPAPARMQSSSPPAERVAVDAERPQQLSIPSSSSSPAAAAGLRHRRTRSDEATTTAAAAFQQGLEPLRIPNARARLETILSGKDGLAAAPQPQPLPERVRRPEARNTRRPRRQRRGRSMSELEFEELKGLQDLGFTFADAEVDAELASIVPGLRRKRSEGVEHLAASASASAPVVAAAAPSSSSSSSSAQDKERRPYLSEAWEDDDDKEEDEVRAALRNWRVPPAVYGADLKEHLRMWAHTVASVVR